MSNIPITEMSDEDQVKAVIEELPSLKPFLIIGRKTSTKFFCSSTITSPVHLSDLILNLMLSAPQFAKPILVAVAKYTEIKQAQYNNHK